MLCKENMRQMVICWLICHRAPFAHLHFGQTWLHKEPGNFSTSSPRGFSFFSSLFFPFLKFHTATRDRISLRHQQNLHTQGHRNCHRPLKVVNILYGLQIGRNQMRCEDDENAARQVSGQPPTPHTLRPPLIPCPPHPPKQTLTPLFKEILLGFDANR